MKHIEYTLLFALAVLALVTSHVSAKEITIAGSTTVQKRILEPAIDAIKSQTGLDVKILGINSGKGFAKLLKGEVVVSISSSPLSLLLEKAGVPDDGTYREHIIDKDVIIPIVHPSNPVSELTWQQLADINTGKIRNWKDVGGPDRKILVITSQPTAATRIVFQKQVMKKEPYFNRVMEVQSTRQEVDRVSKMQGAIGAVSEGFVAMNSDKVKVIRTVEISRPLSFITKGYPDSEVQGIIDFLKSPEAKRHFK